MKDIFILFMTMISTIGSIILKSQKHSIEKIFDSKSEKVIRGILYESLAILGVMFCAFFFIPIKELDNDLLYYVIYIIFVVLFVLAQIIEIFIVIFEYKNRKLPRLMKTYKKFNFQFAVLLIIISTISLIIANIHIYTLLYDLIKEIEIDNNTLAGITLYFIKANDYKEILGIILFLIMTVMLYGVWRMLVAAPWHIINKHFKREISLIIKLTSSEKELSDLSFVNSSDEYFLCYDLKQQHILIYKNSIERIIIKMLPKQ